MGWAASASFYQQLGSMLKAGIPLGQALHLLRERVPPPYRQRLPGLIAGIDAGRPLAELLRAAGEDPFPTAVVGAGEKSGHLPELLAQIVAYYEFAIGVRRLVLGKAIYPLFLLHTALVLPAFVLWFLGKLCWCWIPAGPLAVWLALGGAWLLWRGGTASGLAARVGTLPLVKGLVEPLAAANACLVLHAAVGAGVLFPDALRLAAGCTGNRVWAGRLERAAVDLRQGRLQNLTAALVAVGMPREVIDLVGTGEVSGELEQSLQRAAALQRTRFESRVTWTARVAMGAMVGLAMLIAVIAILFLFGQVYLGTINDLRQELEQ